MDYGTTGADAPPEQGMPMLTAAQSGVQREQPQTDAAERALVSQWSDRIRKAKKHWEDRFKAMTTDMQYARIGASKAWKDAGNYTVPVVARHINNSVAALYARNPRVIGKRKARLLYKLWDGKPASLMQAIQGAAAGDPNSIAVVNEVMQTKATNDMLDKVAKTAASLVEYFMNEQEPTFKMGMKAAVRRAKVCGVAYVTLGYQRTLTMRPDIRAQLTDATQQLATAQRILADVMDGEVPDDSPELAELNATIAALQASPMMVVREGLVFDFPRATEIIPDVKTRALRGWIGTRWLTREFAMEPDEVKSTYKIDVGTSFTKYIAPNDKLNTEGKSDADCGTVTVWEVQDKQTGTEFTIADGYNGYLKKPAPPDAKIERFFTTFALPLNEVEDPEDPFPPSDVTALRDPQDEINRSRQGLREHRRANRPAYGVAKGRLDEADRNNLRDHEASAIIEFNALAPGEKVGDLLEVIQHPAIDPALYDTAPQMQDILTSVGTQQADLGGTSGDTATENSIAEGQRNTEKSSTVDDLDEFLTEVARASAQLCFQEIDLATAQKYVGPGAVWPEFNREQIAEEAMIEIKAGSTGRPNRAAELANMERGMPFLVQIPGINGAPLGSRYADLLDIDVEDLVVDGLPSIVAQNAIAGKQAQGGSGENDPNAQGDQGGNNSPQPQQRQPGPQGAFPQPLA